MRHILFALSVTMVCLSLIGCARNISPDNYSADSAGQVNNAVKGVIVNARPVDISGSQSGVGGTAGAAGGAVAGSAIGGGTRANILGAIGGALIGGMAGSAIEEGVTRQQGMEYIVETKSGSLITIVQGTDAPLAVGTRVIIIYGKKARVIADQTGY